MSQKIKFSKLEIIYGHCDAAKILMQSASDDKDLTILWPISYNLLYQALEIFLKLKIESISKKSDEEINTRKKFNHNIPQMLDYLCKKFECNLTDLVYKIANNKLDTFQFKIFSLIIANPTLQSNFIAYKNRELSYIDFNENDFHVINPGISKFLDAIKILSANIAENID